MSGRRSRRARERDRQRGGVALAPRAIASFLGPGGYVGARADRRALLEWNPRAQSADADILGDLTTLRARSRDLARNTPIAGGAIETVVTCSVGTGLRPQPRIDADYLEIAEEEADAKEREIARLVRYVLTSQEKQLDVAGVLSFDEQQQQIVRSTLESGDVFCVRRYKPRLALPIGLAWQIVEADRVSNPDGVFERPGFVGGIETDDDGMHEAVHISSHYPDDVFGAVFFGRQARSWTRVPTHGDAGRMVLHHAWRRRPNQTRGVPYLAAVIEPLKQLATYGDAELMAAVIGSLFTVFIETAYGDTLGAGQSPGIDSTGAALPPNYKLGAGAILQTLPGEKVSIANPGRPNSQYDPFVLAKIKEIGVALGLPYEVLIKSFQASFSASRASQLEAWRFYYLVRAWLARGFCQPTYESIVTECVALGLVDLPGFFEDPLARQAWLGCTWVGDAPGELDPVAAVDAAEKRVRLGVSSLERETAMLTGEDWETVHRQRRKERKMRQADGLEVDNRADPGAASTSSRPANPDERDEEENREREESDRAA